MRPTNETAENSVADRTARFTVTGMTCSHCATAVTEGVKDILGVTDAAVDLASGSLTVTSTEPLPDAAVRDAVEDAGYQLG